MRMHPVKNIRTRGQKFYSHMYATEFRLLIYRISTIYGGGQFYNYCSSNRKNDRFEAKVIIPLRICDTYLTRVRVLLYAVALHCGTRYLIAVLARPTAQVPRWAGNVSGGPGSIPGRFWRTGVPSFRRCSTEPLHSGSVKYRDVARPLHWPLQYQVRVEGAWKKKKKKNHLESVSEIWIINTKTVFVFWAAISGYFDWKPVESCLDIKTIEGERAISGAYWLNQTGVIFQVKLVYNSMLFYYFWFSHSIHFYRPLSGLLVI